MKVEQLYTSCLAEAAYYIESNGEAAIIDPLRDPVPYIELANSRGAKIKYVFETHFHADFVSGHIDLADKTGATIVFGPTANTPYDSHVAKDGEEFAIGAVTIKTLHTPGHTPESTTWLLIDENGKYQSIFSGDTLFLGDVGRPDLVASEGVTREDLASDLFDSLRNKIMPLPDDVVVYPGHGAGSSCGKNMSDETVDTLGNQKKFNYALRENMTRDEFIKEVTDGILPPPQYFSQNATMNKKGYDPIEGILDKGCTALTVDQVEEHWKQGKLILDVRTKQEFAEKHIPGSIFIGLDGNFAMWVGALIEDLKRPIVLVVDKERVKEAVTRLARVGYDNTIGYLEGGIQNWEQNNMELSSVKSIEASEMSNYLDDNKVLDVRKSSEYEEGHVSQSQLFTLDYINENLNQIDKDQAYLVYCKSGYRSCVAVSILQSKGSKNLINVNGGFEAISKTGVPITEPVA